MMREWESEGEQRKGRERKGTGREGKGREGMEWNGMGDGAYRGLGSGPEVPAQFARGRVRAARSAGLSAVLCCAVLCCAVLCCVVLCCVVLCYAVQCCAVAVHYVRCTATRSPSACARARLPVGTWAFRFSLGRCRARNRTVETHLAGPMIGMSFRCVLRLRLRLRLRASVRALRRDKE